MCTVTTFVNRVNRGICVGIVSADLSTAVQFRTTIICVSCNHYLLLSQLCVRQKTQT